MFKRTYSHVLFFMQFLMAWAVIGAVSALFMKFVRVMLHLVWETLPEALFSGDHPWYFYFALPVIGGILVGLCQISMGDNPKQMKDNLKNYRKTGRFNYRKLPKGFITTMTSLTFGAGLGPEVELIDIIGSLGTRVSDKVKGFAGKAGILDINSEDAAFSKRFKITLVILAILVFMPAFFALMLLMEMQSGAMADSSGYRFELIHILYMLPAAALGYLGGLFYKMTDQKLAVFFGEPRRKPFWSAVSAGVLAGAVAVFLPLVLFSGQHEFRYLVAGMYEQGAFIVILTGFLKIFLATCLINAGWKGGPFMPLTFGGAALGLGISMLIPGAPPIVGVMAGAAGTLMAYVGNPVGAIILVQLLFAPNVTVITAVSAVLCWIPAKLVKISRNKGSEKKEQAVENK